MAHECLSVAMKDKTLCFLVRGNPTQVLLGFKKAGFGAGKYMGSAAQLNPARQSKRRRSGNFSKRLASRSQKMLSLQ
jgi:hypothetical protein